MNPAHVVPARDASSRLSFPILPLLHAAIGLAFATAAGAAMAAPGAHVHGVAAMTVVVEGESLEIQLDAPLDTLLGFEHAPRTERQRAAVRAMANRLRDAKGVFAPTPDAQCAVQSVQLVSAALPADLLGEAPAAPNGKAGKAHEHSDLEARFVFRCASASRLQGLDTSLQSAFPGMKTLKVQVVSPRGQKAMTLGKGRTALQW